MDIELLIYIGMLLTQAYSLSRIIGEAKACKWSVQARWIAYRTGGVIIGIIIVTALCGWFLQEKENFSEWLIIIALGAMTILLVTHISMIITAMSDEEVGDNLNIKNKQHE